MRYATLVAVLTAGALSGCTIGSPTFKNMFDRNVSVPSGLTLDANVALQVKYTLAPEMREHWKKWLNSDETIANYEEAGRQGLRDILVKSRLFSNMSETLGTNSDFLVSLDAEESRPGRFNFKAALAVIDPRTQRQVSRFAREESFDSGSNLFAAVSRVLTQVTGDVRSDLQAKDLRRLARPAPTPPPAERRPEPPLPPADREAPTIAINYPPAGTRVEQERILVTGLITDNVDVARVEITVNGASVALPTGTAAVGRGFPIRVPVPLEPGDNLIEITAGDAAGNVSQVVRTVTRIAPVLATLAPLPPAPAPPPAPTSSAALPATFGRYYALVIGNQAYQRLRPLKTPVADATAVADLLRREYRFAGVQLLTNATRAQIIGALDEQRRRLGETDNLLIYYAGHGWLDRDTDRGYWLPIDAEQDSRRHWLSNADITDTLKALKAKHVVVVADSCYAGTLSRSIGIQPLGEADLMRLAQKKARTVLTSGGLEPVTDVGGGTHSAFAKAFLEVLRGNRSAADLTSLFAAIRRQVLLNAEQTPEYADLRLAGHDGGDFIFFRPK